MSFEPNYLTTIIGSVPYTNTLETCERVAGTIDIPTWPQMVKLDFRENMYTQYGAVLPAIVIDDENEKISFDTTGDITPALEIFYQHFLDENVDYFGLPQNYTAGFYNMMDTLGRIGQQPATSQGSSWMKGQVTGPVSMGLTITDQDLRASLYHELLADVLVKNAAMNARWQIRRLKAIRPGVIIFVDEPYMASFGSAFISLSRDQVISMLDEVFDAIHTEGGLAGVHCCANTDWSVLLDTQVDILNLDTFGYINNLALYPAELRRFLDRGGVIAWGLVPNNQAIDSVTPKDLVHQLRQGIAQICEKAGARDVTIKPEAFDNRSLITPACGLGSTTPEIADKVLSVLVETGKLLRD